MKLILCISLALTLHNVNASASRTNQIFLYAPDNSLDYTAEEVKISADSASSIVDLTFPKIVTMRNISSYCSSGEPQYGDIDGFIANIIGIPSGPQSSVSGLSYKLGINWPGYPRVSNVGNYSFYIQSIPNYWPLDLNPIHQCWKENTSVGLGHGSIPAKASMTITVDRGTATPGYYDLLIPMYHAYSELKVHGYGNTPPIGDNWPNLIMKKSSLRHTRLPVLVTSNCNITNGNVIQLNHGVMTPKSAVNNEAKTTVDLTCTYAATVNLKLLGNEIDNKSSCSSWGTCELTFDNGTNEDKLSISGTKKLTIKSTFKPKALEPIVAGKFTAHGVLQILVE